MEEYETDFMICFNCKNYKEEWCYDKQIGVNPTATCSVFDEDTNPKKEKKSLREVKRQELLKKLNIRNVYENVELFHEERPFFYDKNKLFWFWNKEEYQYNIVDDTDLVNAVVKEIEVKGIVSSTLKNEYLESFKQIGRNNIPKEPPIEWIQFKDQIINIETGDQERATPKYFFTNPIPWTIGESIDTPVMDKLFEQWVGVEYVDTLYQIIAYCCYRGYPLHRLFCFVGPGSNGKSCLQNIINKLLGDNCSSSDLDLILHNRFESSYALYKKLCCMIGETNFNVLKNTNYLKKATGGDPVRIEFKNKGTFKEDNYAKIIIATNSLPMTEDKSEGFYRRWLIIQFPNKFTEKKNILKTIPDEEYRNLACKVIQVLKKLLKKREFKKEGSIEHRKKAYEDISNPIQKFIKEYTTKDYSSYTHKYMFRDAVTLYLEQTGQRVWSENDINSYMKGVYNDGRRGTENYWAWLGFTLKKQASTTSTTSATSHLVPYMEPRVSTSGSSGSSGSKKKDTLDDDKQQVHTLEEIEKGIKKRNEKGINFNDETLINTIKRFDRGRGVSEVTISRIYTNNDMMERLDKLKTEGLAYNPKPGIWRLI